MTRAEPVIVARDLTRVFGAGEAARKAVDAVSLSVERGEVVLIFGPSGCGKSTLLSMLGGLDRSFQGKLSLFGQDVSALSDAELSRLRGERIGFVFQAFHLLGHLTVLENVMVPALFARDEAGRPVVERAREVLERVGLADRAGSTPAELSGGQRQRVAIARALLHKPTLLLCDEPTGNLDRKTGEQIIDLFAGLHEDFQSTIVIVTHEDRLTRLAHRTIDMVDGQLGMGREHEAVDADVIHAEEAEGA
ncbi:MAG: ABC transporter ATP-binding protein [Myxococcales bacterium]|nr:ABC transporter ATP-binding protein [Myxococcales bacterium]